MLVEPLPARLAAEQKPDLQYDGLRGYAARAGLDVVQDHCDVAVSGRWEGRPQLNALMVAARNQKIDYVLVGSLTASPAARATSWRRWRSSTTSACASSACRTRWTQQPDGPGHVHHHRRHGRA